MTELQHQICVMKWSQQPSIRSKYPELRLLYHVPNERKCSPQQGALLKKAGVKSGVPDLVLPVPRGHFHGLYIEMKDDDGTPSMEQRWWLEQLGAQGYMTDICYGWESATLVIEEYLSSGTAKGGR